MNEVSSCYLYLWIRLRAGFLALITMIIALPTVPTSQGNASPSEEALEVELPVQVTQGLNREFRVLPDETKNPKRTETVGWQCDV